jgi:hypothetical protein
MAGEEFDEALCFELPETFADGNSTHTELCGHLILPELVPSLKQAPEDRFPEHFGHQLRGTSIPLGDQRSNAREIHGGYSYTICKYTILLPTRLPD